MLITYRVPAAFLTSYLPAGLEPDRMPGDGPEVGYVSLVAFQFLDTRVKGIAVPGHRNFPEVNLRAYVRPPQSIAERGVVFIAELVPKPAITMVANVLYHENYRTLPMNCVAADEGNDRRRMTMEVELGERVHRIEAVGRRPPVETQPGSVEHFFKEHTWGYGSSPEGGRVRYRVEHPEWRVFPCGVDDITLDVSFAELYGEPWSALDDMEPFHVAFAEGSEIAVYPKD